MFGLPCRIPCPLDEIVWEVSFVNAFQAAIYVTLVVEYLCCFIVFYTWARERQLFRFPHSITFVMNLLNFVRSNVFMAYYLLDKNIHFCCFITKL
jgi:hypothetical protein